MLVNVTGSPSSVSINLEGTIDGTNWFVLANSGNTGQFLMGGVLFPVKGVRANLTDLSGGSSPTVTATVVAASLLSSIAISQSLSTTVTPSITYD
jgi:hypothetical protein